jgi:hypothetical protein
MVANAKYKNTTGVTYEMQARIANALGLLLVAASAAAFAADRDWVEVARLPGVPLQTTDLAADDASILLAAENGVFRSVDQGAHWTAVNNDLPAEFFAYGVAVNGSNALVAGADGALFRTFDHGSHWVAAGQTGLAGLPSGQVSDLVLRDTSSFALVDGEVFRLSAGEAAWQHVDLGIPQARPSRVLAASGRFVFVGTEHGAYRSADDGAHWAPLDAPQLLHFSFYELAVSGDRLIAYANTTLAFSSDGGAHWAPVTREGLNPRVSVGKLSITGGTTFTLTFAGLARLSNDGAAWNVVTNFPAIGEVAGLAASGSSLLASSTRSPVLRSADAGAHWSTGNAGLPAGEAGVNRWVFATRGKTAFAASDAGLFRSNDEGAHWAQVPGVHAVKSLAVSGTHLIASTAYYDGYSGLFRSTDDGAHWQAASVEALPGIPNEEYGSEGDTRKRIPYEATSLAISGAAVYVVLDGKLYRGADSDAAWVSKDPANWKEPSAGLPRIRVIAADGTALLAATDDGVFRSTNNGATWSPANAGLPANTVVRALIVDRATLFAGTQGAGVFRSNDHGGHWLRVGTAPAGSHAVTALAVRGTQLYAGIEQQDSLFTQHASVWMILL